MLVKVCGMRDASNIREVDALGPDFMGFIFHGKSPRNVTEVPEYLPVAAQRVGVFVDKDLEFILRKVAQFDLTHVQLHGNESPALCAELRGRGLKVIKAFSVAVAADLARTCDYADCCDLFVFDTKCDSAGGSGRQFDWNVLLHYEGPVGFLLSGGIGCDTDLKSFEHQYLVGYDLNSRFELAPGVKDAAALDMFIRNIRIK